MQTLSPADYATIVQQAPILIWRAGPDARCDYFNDRWLAFTGRTLEQELGDGWADGVHPDDRQHCLRTFLDAFERRQEFEMVYRLRRHDGRYRLVLDRGSPTTDAAGRFSGFLGCAIDITERERLLRGFVSICAWCKKVHDEADGWIPIEICLRRHSDADFSHSLCPDCEARMALPESR